MDDFDQLLAQIGKRKPRKAKRAVSGAMLMQRLAPVIEFLARCKHQIGEDINLVLNSVQKRGKVD